MNHTIFVVISIFFMPYNIYSQVLCEIVICFIGKFGRRREGPQLSTVRIKKEED